MQYIVGNAHPAAINFCNIGFKIDSILLQIENRVSSIQHLMNYRYILNLPQSWLTEL